MMSTNGNSERVTRGGVAEGRKVPSIPNSRLRPLTTETTGELEVLGLDGDTLGVDGGQVGCELARAEDGDGLAQS